MAALLLEASNEFREVDGVGDIGYWSIVEGYSNVACGISEQRSFRIHLPVDYCIKMNCKIPPLSLPLPRPHIIYVSCGLCIYNEQNSVILKSQIGCNAITLSTSMTMTSIT